MPRKLKASAGETALLKARAIMAWRDAYYPDASESDGPWLEHLTPQDMQSPPDGDVLNFAGLGLTKLPEELGDADSVGFLFLQSNQLESIDASLLSGMGLTSLCLSGNPLKQVPEALFHIESLLDLYLNDTPLQTLPVPTADVPHFATLNLADNPRLTLPPGFLPRFTQLKALILDGYAAADFPRDVLALTRLKQLSLERTRFCQLPADIARLTDLRQLALDDAQITTLPKSIATMLSLAGPAAKLNFMGLRLAKTPFVDKELKKIAKLKNPARTLEAMAWAAAHGADGA